MSEGPIPKLMHDANTRRHRKVRVLLRMEGPLAYGRYWILMERLREEKENRLDCTEVGFWSDMATELMCTETDAQEFFERLTSRFCLLQFDGRFYFSDRIVDDVSRFQAKLSAQSNGGKIGAAQRWGINSLPISNCSLSDKLPNGLVVGEYLTLTLDLDLNSKIPIEEKKELIRRAREAHPVSHAVLAHCKKLITEFSKECFTHYVKLCTAHAKAKGMDPESFVSWLEVWMRKDAAERRGWFAGNGFNAQKRADRKILQ